MFERRVHQLLGKGWIAEIAGNRVRILANSGSCFPRHVPVDVVHHYARARRGQLGGDGAADAAP
jgi:hypothetical protein